MRIFLARHGETETGPDGLYYPDSGLTNTGHLQAAELAGALASMGIDMSFTSGLRRARETAEHFAGAAGLVATPIDALNEIAPGDIYSASLEEKQSIIKHEHGLDFTEFGGEEPIAFQRRVVTGFDDMLRLAQSSGAETVVAFIHGGTIGALIDHLAGLPFDYRRRERMPNCSYAFIDTAGVTNAFVQWQSSHLSVLT